MKKILTSVLCCCMLMTLFIGSYPKISAATDGKYTENGLVARYDGSQNGVDGHDIYSNVWQDLSSNGYDIDLSGKSDSYFTKHGLVIDHESFVMNDAVLNTINSEEFTVEVCVGEIYSTGKDFTTFINSVGNDNFALFLNTSGNYIQFKANSNARPGKTEGVDNTEYHTLAVTFSLNSFSRLYIDGVLVSSEVPTELVQAIGPIHLSSVANNKLHKAEYRNIRVYSRALSASELVKNADSDRVTYITDTSPVLPLVVNVAHHLDNTDVYFNNLSYKASECTFTSKSSAVSVSGGKILATSAGIYDMTVKYGEFSKNIKAVVREQDTYEFVLHSNDFSSSLPSDYKIVSGSTSTIYTSGGYLYVNGAGTDMTRVVLPSSLNSFGDYKITVVASINNPEDTARWGSIMFRVQNSDCPFYQMCFRQNAAASNGVEFALRNTNNSWSVYNTAAYSSALTAGTNYTFTVKTSGSIVKEYINGTLVLTSDSMGDYNTGTIGICANKSLIKVDSIKVTLNASSIPETPYTVIAQPTTDIIGGICFSEIIDNTAKLEKLSTMSVKPANAIFYVNEKQEICTADYSKTFATMEKAIAALDGKIMPTFYVKDTASAEAVCRYLTTYKITDVFIMSDSSDVLLYVKDRYVSARRVLDLRNEYKGHAVLSKETCLEIRSKATKSWATTVVLPACCATFNVVKCLQDMIMTTWLYDDAGTLNSATRAFDLIAHGTYGVISDNTQLLYDVTKNLMGSNVLTRAPLNIGHRGLPSQAPENTLEGAKLAYSAGADCIEVDIYLTTDNQIVIMHDANTKRTCNGVDWNLEEHTLAELKTLSASYGNSNYSSAKIPTLEEYYKEFKGKDVRIFVEIKSYKPEIVTYLKELTEKYEITNQVSVIAFGHTGACQTMREVWPEMSLGYLTTNIATGGTSEAQVKNVLNSVQPLGSTYNPQYGGHASGFFKAANMRCLTSWPWTYANNSDADNYLLYGANGLTTNTCDYFGSYAKTLKVLKSSYKMSIGQTHTAVAYLSLYNRNTTDVAGNANSRIIIIEGGDIASVSGKNITVNGIGKVTYAVEYTQTMKSGSKYTVVTTPVTLYTGSGIKGDVNGDGKVTTSDLLDFDAYINGKSDNIDKSVADLNGDGVLDVSDEVLMVSLVR